MNIICNIFYAFFNAIAMLSLWPVINVLFGSTEKVCEKPVWKGISKLSDYGTDYLNFFVTKQEELSEGSSLTYVVIIIISMFLLKNVFNYLANYFITFLRNGVLRDLRNDVYDKTIRLPLSYFSEKRKGDTISRISGDVNSIQTSFLAVLELIIKEPLTILFAIIAMFGISVKLTVFVFIFIPVSGFFISLLGKKLKKHSDKVMREQGFFFSIVEETLGGLKVIKGFTAELLFNKKFHESTSRYYKYSNNLANRQNLASPISEFLGISVIAIILWYGGNMVLVEKTLDPGLFLTYMGLSYSILTPAKAISRASYSIKSANAAAERVLELLNTISPLKDRPNAKDKRDFISNITLEDISFKYDEEYVLQDFQLEIPKGKAVALVGQSGSGKSTIANMVTRFYDVNKGAIKIDGTDIRELNKKSLRSLMGLVTQDSILFNDTIKNNLLIGKEDATDDEIIEALKVANAWEFVKELPNTIETNIGDSGNKLSGGQKQRLSIARAVLKNPPIMILDEATSALDTESERLVQSALENMMKNRTSIVIAHRLSTIQNADLIVVMKKGRIVEQGTHESLLALNGTYQKLVTMQSFDA